MPILKKVNNKNAIIIWQMDKDGLGEPALLVSIYTGMIGIMQEGKEILINDDTIKTLMSVLRDYNKTS